MHETPKIGVEERTVAQKLTPDKLVINPPPPKPSTNPNKKEKSHARRLDE